MQTQDSGVPLTDLALDNTAQNPNQSEIQIWLVNYLGQLLEVNTNEIDPTVCFDRYGLDSSAAIGLVADLSEYIGYDLDPDLLSDRTTIQSVAQYCSELEEVTL